MHTCLSLDVVELDGVGQRGVHVLLHDQLHAVHLLRQSRQLVHLMYQNGTKFGR